MASPIKSPPLPQSWKCCVALACNLLVLMMGSTEAGRGLNEDEPRLKLRAYTDDTNRPRHAPPAQSYLVSDGSWVDCVPIEGQIAAHHPSLRDHIIQLKPSKSIESRPFRSGGSHPQLFAREHGGCPDGYIPVQRRHISRVRSRKTQSPQSSGTPAAGGVDTHEYAATGMPVVPGAYYGTSIISSVNAPTVADPSGFSLSQLWIADAISPGFIQCTIEVGWQTYPNRHKNNQEFAPHLFVFWTANGYKGLGCYDLDCAGFVQVNNRWVIGGAMPSYTTLAELSYEVQAEVFTAVQYDPTQGNWWLYLNNAPIGYWPAAIYGPTCMQGSASKIQWGGEIDYSRNSSAHTKTVMGSGLFPLYGYPLAAYIRDITYADVRTGYTGVPVNPAVLMVPDNLQRTDPNCYDISVQMGNRLNWGTYFFFGGPGGLNPACVGSL